ncbi:MAG: DUF167 domain-containing protein [Sandaracinaceae bacterium]|nr:DUF167 domain-containing protein [Sandaracinaceae bacterium]
MSSVPPAFVTLQIKVQPRAKRTAFQGMREGVYRIALAAPPVDGEANAELVAFLAGLLGVTKKSVTVVRGASSKQKLVRVDGVSIEDVARALEIAE